MTHITLKKVKDLINQSTFLTSDQKKDFLSSLKNVKKIDLDSVYESFLEAKRKAENVYIQIALQHNPEMRDLLIKNI